MELKLQVVTCYKFIGKFKSHLYGIEIRISQDTERRAARLNRTFMELKLPDANEGTRTGAV